MLLLLLVVTGVNKKTHFVESSFYSTMHAFLPKIDLRNESKQSAQSHDNNNKSHLSHSFCTATASFLASPPSFYTILQILLL
jgi:hypothetical protein